MKNFFKKVSSLTAKKAPLITLLMIPAIIFSVFIYSAGATNTILIEPTGGEKWSGTQTIEWKTDWCEANREYMGNTHVNIYYSTNTNDFMSLVASNVNCLDGQLIWDTNNATSDEGMRDSNKYRITVKHIDGTYDTSAKFTIDNTIPEINITDGVNVGPVQTDTIAFTASDNLSGVDYVGYAIKSTDEDCDTITAYTEVSRGTFDIGGNETTGLCMTVKDNANNEIFQDLGLLNTDNTNPEITVTPLDGTIVSGDFNLEITTTDLNSTTTRFIISSTESYILPTTEPGLTQLAASADWIDTIIYNNDTWTAVIISTKLNDGNNSFSVEAIDEAGNVENTGAITYIVDNNLPVTTITPTPTTTWYTSEQDIALECNDTTTSCSIFYRWGETGDFLPYPSSGGLTASGGDIDLHYYSVDEADNTEITQTANFKVDLTDPTITGLVDIITNRAFTTAVTTSDTPSGIASYKWTSTSDLVGFSSTDTENTTIQITTSDSDGVYPITLKVTDNAGRITTQTINFTWDKTKPTIDGLTEPTKDKVYKTNDTFTSFTPKDNLTKVTCSFKVDSQIVTTPDCTKNSLYTLIVEDYPLSEGRHVISGMVTDAAGNSTAEYSYSIVIDEDDTLTVDGDGSADFTTIQAAIDAATSEDTIQVAAGTYIEIGQIVINKNLTITGADKTTTIVKPAQDTGTTYHADKDSWILVNSGKILNINNFTFDGEGKTVAMGILSHGHGIIDNNIFKNIKSSTYGGFAIELFGSNMTVNNNHFSNIGRIGIYNGNESNSINSGNTYVGKGSVDSLDYAIEVGRGSHTVITNNTITENKGVASVDGSTSAGIMVTSYFGPGASTAEIENNTISNCSTGIFVGYNSSDISVVRIFENKLFNNGLNVVSSGPEVDAIQNWWGVVQKSSVEPTLDTASLINYNPWCLNQACSLLSSSDIIKPTVIITSDSTDNFVKAGEVIEITATFSDTNGLDTGIVPTISITDGGTITNIPMTGSGNIWTYDWTVPAGDTPATILVKAYDIVGNPNQAATGQTSFTIDSTLPVVAIKTPVASSNLLGGSNFDITWTTTEDNKDTVSISYTTDGSNWTSIATSDADDGTYPWTIPSITSNTVQIKVVATDLAGNEGEGTSSTFSIDSSAPTAIITFGTVKLYDGDLIQEVTVTYNEDVITTSNPNISITTETGSSTAFAEDGTPAWNGRIWTGNFITTDNQSVGTLKVTANGVLDLAGNTQTEATGYFNIDTENPTATVSVNPIQNNDTANTQIITTNFSETMDITVTPVTTFTNTTTAFASASGVWTVNNTVWTEIFDVSDEEEEITATVTVTGTKDIIGNNQETPASTTLDIDTLNPEISNILIIGNNDTTPNLWVRTGDLLTMTFKTSEATNAPAATFQGNTATSITSPDQLNWTATYTMLSGDAEGTISFTVNATDLAGNAATQKTGSAGVKFDRTSATITLVDISSDNDSGNDTLARPTDIITLIFSTNEIVTLGNIKIAGNLAESLTQTPDTNEYTATYEMTSNDDEGMISYEINTIDQAGNTSNKTKTTEEDTVNFDKTLPTLTSVNIISNNHVNNLAKVNDTVTLSFTASETLLSIPVATIDGESVIVTGTHPNYSTSLLLDNANTSGNIVFTINSIDLAGNIGTPITEIDSLTSVLFDKTAPSFINLTPSNGTYTSDTTPLIGANFFEEGSGIYPLTGGLEVDGIDVSDFAYQDIYGIHFQPNAPLSDGFHTATIRITDNARNNGFKTWQFEVAATAKSLNITSDKAQVFADGTSQAKITVQALDAGTPVTTGQVTFSSPIGTITTSPVTVDSNGTAVTYISSSEVGNAVITASYDFSGDIKTDTVNVEFVDTIKTLTISATPLSILADGNETAVVNVVVLENGLPTTGEVVIFSTDLGTLNSTTNTSTVLSSTVAGTATITATYNTGSEVITKTAAVIVTEAPIIDTTKPTATTNPIDDADNVATTINPVITFSEAMNESSLTGQIALKKYSTSLEVPATISIETVGGITAVTISPTSNLAKDTDYYFTISTVEDLAGNNMESTWTKTDNFGFTTKADVTEYSISLNAGWNLISLPIIPEDSAIETVLAGLTGNNLDNVDTVQYYDALNEEWQTYKPGVTSELERMEDGKGYWINVLTADTLIGAGVETELGVSIPRSYEVQSGWNMIGFKSAYTQVAEDYIGEIGTNDVIWKYNQGYSEIEQEGLLESNYGYWLFNHGSVYTITPKS